MIVRIVVVDPTPRDKDNDIIVYQVPENSRAYELLIRLLEDASIEHATIESTRRKSRNEA